LIADALAAQGFSSLRIDKRLIGKSGKAGPASEAELRFDDYIDDAVSWAGFLRRQPGVHCVVILGHSEGALIAAAAAHRAPVCGVISLSGVGRLFPATLHAQLKATGTSDALLAAVDHTISELQAGRLVPDAPPMLRPGIQPYLISQLRYDPVATLAAVRVPVLIEQGTNDLQVSVEDARRLAAGQPHAKLVLVQGANHMLKTAPTDRAANLATYADPDLPLSAGVIDPIVEFLKARGRRSATARE